MSALNFILLFLLSTSKCVLNGKGGEKCEEISEEMFSSKKDNENNFEKYLFPATLPPEKR